MSSVVFMCSVYYAFAVFCYQILLSPLCSWVHIQVWFYFTWPHCFYLEGVFAWDIIAYVRFMHCYGSRIFDSHIVTLAEVYQKIPYTWKFLWHVYSTVKCGTRIFAVEISWMKVTQTFLRLAMWQQKIYISILSEMDRVCYKIIYHCQPLML